MDQLPPDSHWARACQAPEAGAEACDGLLGVLADTEEVERAARAVADQATVEIRIQLPFGERTCGARVVRGGDLPHARSELRHWLALELTDVEPAVQREITRFIFDLQRELMRRDVR